MDDMRHLPADVFRLAFNKLPAAAVLVDSDLTVRFWNSAASSLLGWEASEAVGRPLAGISPQERAEAIELIMLKREGEIRRELDWAARDGTMMRVELALTPLMDTEAPGWLFFGILTDLGEQYREEAKQRAQTMDALSRFAGAIAHDFNNR